MDVGIFKASRARLILWIAVPPLLMVGVGLSAYALQRQSQWQLNRTEVLAKVLPRFVKTQREASTLLAEFKGLGTSAIQSEDQLMSFLEETAQRAGFAVDSVKVERRVSAENRGMPVLIGNVKGAGGFDAIAQFIANVTSEQHLLSEQSVKITQSNGGGSMDYGAELTVELLLFNELKKAGGR